PGARAGRVLLRLHPHAARHRRARLRGQAGHRPDGEHAAGRALRGDGLRRRPLPGRQRGVPARAADRPWTLPADRGGRGAGRVLGRRDAERRGRDGRGEQSEGRYGGRMIERYTLPEMGRVWSDAHKYELWCRVEVLVLEAQARAGTVPAESVEPVRSAQSPTPEAVAAVEAVTDHDVIAFLTAWADNTEPRSAAAWVHYGMTSSDLLDTALAVQLAEASDLLIAKATGLVAVLRDHALAHRDTLRPGRTHGVHAEPDV